MTDDAERFGAKDLLVYTRGFGTTGFRNIIFFVKRCGKVLRMASRPNAMKVTFDQRRVFFGKERCCVEVRYWAMCAWIISSCSPYPEEDDAPHQ